MNSYDDVYPITVIIVTDETSDYHVLQFIFYQKKNLDEIFISTQLHKESLDKKFLSEKDERLKKINT